MPYKRSYRNYRRKRNYRRPKSRPNIQQVKFPTVAGMSVPQMARYGAVGYNILKGLINSELKRFDVGNTVIPTTTPVVVSLCDIPQGDDVGDRDGNKLLAKYIKFEANIAMDNTQTTTFVRMIIFVDTENQGVIPVASDVLESTAASVALVSPINKDNTQRFTVLADRCFSFSNTGQQSVHTEVFRNLNFHISYTTTLSTSRNKNSIWLMYLSDQGTETPVMIYQSRLAFYDN